MESPINSNQTIIVDRCYLCDTPYQVFTCIHIELHEKHNADIYILNSFSAAKNIVEVINNYTIFRKAFLISDETICNNKTHKTKLRNHLNTIRQYLSVDKLFEANFEKNIEYNHIFFTCNHICFRLFRFYHIKHKRRSVFHLYDEGIGSYDGHFENIKFYDRIIRNILFGKKASTMKYDIFLYKPELYYDYYKRKTCVHKIVPFDHIDFNHLPLFAEIFQVTNRPITKNVIFFDAVREEIFTNDWSLSKMAEWYSTIESYIGYDKMYLKSHPRAMDKYPHKCENYPSSKCPMEIEYLNMDMDNMVLITLASTAVITPKLLYDKEPIVLLLCNIDNQVYKPNNNQLAFYKSIQSIYRDKTKIMILKNEESMKECLIKISKILS